MTREISRTRLKEVLHYNDDTGVFTWLERTVRIGYRDGSWNTRYAGNPAGRINGGYSEISIDGIRYLAHRLAWLYIHGEMPLEIDHINRNRSSNEIGNLRICETSQNHANAGRPSHNTSGYKGVSWCSRQRKWRAVIQNNSKQIYLGRFKEHEKACAAYLGAAREIYGEFACAG